MSDRLDDEPDVDTAPPRRGETPSAGRRAGYLVAIAVNAALAYVANNILEWDVLPFLTEDFDRVLPAINATLAVTIAANLARLWYDPKWFVAVTDLVSTAVGLVASIRMWRVFPFDFESYDVRWDLAVRALLVIAIIGSVIGIVVGAVKLVTDRLAVNGEP